MNQNMLDSIRLYHSHGLACTPLNDKVPYLDGWQKTKWSPQLEQGAFERTDSAGFVIPDNYVVIDVDNHTTDDSKPGTESLQKLSSKIGFDLFGRAGVIVNTASGGHHLYYKLPAKYSHLSVSNAIKEFPSVEFKGRGRQVVIPGSRLSDGRAYSFSIISRGFDSIVELPDVLSLALVKMTTGPKAIKPRIKPLDAEIDKKKFETFLETLPEIASGQRNNEMYKLACEGRDYALSQETVLEILSNFNDAYVNPPLSKHEVIHCINSAFRYANNETPSRSAAFDFPENEETRTEPEKLSDQEAEKQFSEVIDWKDTLVKGAKGSISSTKFATKNTEIFLENLPEFRSKLAVNLFSMDTIWRKPAPWHQPTILTGEIDKILDDDDLIRIKNRLNELGFDPATSHILEASRAVSLRNEYHPVKEYFDSLPKWDNKNRLEKFFPEFCGAEDCAYSRALGVKIFTAIVARIFNPGCKFDYLPILIGEQGIGKSTLLETIAIKPQWYTDNLGSIDNKDVILRMRSKLIVENAELTMFDKNDANSVKAFLSRRVDRDRLPYDRLPRDLPRQCVIIATTNKDRFLQDETGNRRMWPIEVTKIFSDEIKRALPMLYAEAIFRFKNGEKLFLDEESSSNIAKEKQAERFEIDDWEPKIENWLDANEVKHVTIGILWDQCFGRDIVFCKLPEQKRIGSVLRHLGWVRGSVKIDGKVLSGFKKK